MRNPGDRESAGKVNAADIGSIWLEWFGSDLAGACEAFPFETAGPIMERYCDDPALIQSHFPWVAFAVEWFRRRQSSDLADKKPAEFRRQLYSAKATARKLERQLMEIKATVFAASDNLPKFLQYVRVYDRMLGQFAEVDDAETARQKFMWWTTDLDALAWAVRDAAISLIPPHWEKRRLPASSGSGPRLRGLGAFVVVLSAVWRSMTGRSPTARQVFKKGVGEGDDNLDPDFVRFTIDLAKAAKLRPPTRSAVGTALKAR